MMGAFHSGWLQASAAEPMAGAGWFIGAVLIALIFLGAPLFVVIGGLAFAAFIAFPEVAGMLESLDAFSLNFNFIERMVELAEQPTMVAIPFFMIAGAIMSRGAIAQRLVDFANALFGWLPGGLALSTIAACMFFAAISGSSPVTVITIGAIMLPALARAGYPESLGLGLVTSAGTLGIIIPPSIPMIVYAIFASSSGEPVNIEELFIAGIGPGILIGLLLAGYCIYKGRAVERLPFDLRRIGETFLDGVWSLFLPLLILGGIYLGLFNATEASAISVVLALVIELFIHKSITTDELPEILGETSVLMGSILIIICVAFGFSEFMTVKEIPDAIVTWLSGWFTGLEISAAWQSVVFILLLNVLLIIVGCMMDIISAIILFVPLVAPIAAQLGFDPVHVGLIFIVNLEIGYLTPPLGLNLFVATTYFHRPFGAVIRSVLPFLLILVSSLMIVTYVPTISLGFGNFQRGEDIWSSFPTGKTLQPPAVEGDDEDEDGNEEAGGAVRPSAPSVDDGPARTVQDLMNDPAYLEMMEDDDLEDEDEDEDDDELDEEDLEEEFLDDGG